LVVIFGPIARFSNPVAELVQFALLRIEADYRGNHVDKALFKSTHLMTPQSIQPSKSSNKNAKGTMAASGCQRSGWGFLAVLREALQDVRTERLWMEASRGEGPRWVFSV
jgi:hypothetical protein